MTSCFPVSSHTSNILVDWCIFCFLFKLMVYAKRGMLDSNMKQSERAVLPCTETCF